MGVDAETISKASIKQPFWAMKTGEAVAALKSGPEGLSEEEVVKRRKIFGENSIKEEARLQKVKIILNQFKNPLILGLIIAGAITGFLKSWVDTSVILAAVAVNAALGFWQENKAEEALKLLKSYIKTRVRARRENIDREIDSSELVPGDIVYLAQGIRAPADARIIFTKNLEADEAVLTGESLPVEKKFEPAPVSTILQDQKSMVFNGTLIVRGIGEAIVTATGNETEFGKIAELVSEKEKKPTPLQRSIFKFTVVSGSALLLLSFFLFGVGLYAGYPVYEMFLIAVAVAVSAVPEGLPIALTVILAIGVERLSKKKGIVRKLLAAETLGSTSVILTDKTGTLTEAKMELVKIILKSGLSEKEFLAEALQNTDTIVENPEAEISEWKIAGNPLEIAIVKKAALAGIKRQKRKILEKFPFTHENKFSAVISEERGLPAGEAGAKKTVLMGAPETLVRMSNLGKNEKNKILEETGKYAYEGARVIGLARGAGEVFENLEFLGLMLMRDPVRAGVRHAVKEINKSGVKTAIVTGDHQGTAEYVARELGFIDGKGAVLTGEDLAHLTDGELKNRLDETTVFARVTPRDKLRLVNLFREKGEIVAVTGDGIDDAPALEAADIGIAVGSGTDVAKSAADLIILDDNFETIVAAIEEGRRIMDNVRKVVVYLFSNSLDALCLIGGSLIAGLALPLSAIQILLVNFFTDSFPAIALAFEKGLDDAVDKRIAKKADIFTDKVKFLIFVIGVVTSLLLFLIYFFMIKYGFPEKFTHTFIFAAFATYTLFLSFSVRSLEKNIFSYNPFGNAYLVAGALIGFALTFSVIYFPPLQKIFDTVSLPAIWLLAVLGIGFFNISLVEFSKWLFRKKIL